MASEECRIPIAVAGLSLKLSYNQVRRLIAIGELAGGYDESVGYYVSRAALAQRLEQGAGSTAAEQPRRTP